MKRFINKKQNHYWKIVLIECLIPATIQDFVTWDYILVIMVKAMFALSLRDTSQTLEYIHLVMISEGHELGSKRDAKRSRVLSIRNICNGSCLRGSCKMSS